MKRKIVTFTILFCLVGQMAFAAKAEPAPETPEKAAFLPEVDDFAGEYTCTTISFGEDIIPLEEGESYTLKIEGEEAVITGMEELGTDPKQLVFESGELTWTPPEEDQAVFKLGLLEDGVVTLTFVMIPEAPVFRFDPEISPEEFVGEYTCTSISFGEDLIPLEEGESYTLKIEGEEAVITGMEELGTDPKQLVFENGELTWTPPEEDQVVFKLALLDDGVVTLTFVMIPEAPVFRFDPDTK